MVVHSSVSAYTQTTVNKILIIEDDTLLLGAMENLLKLHGFEVFSTCNGLEAKELVGTSSPDLVVCDLMLPGSDGFAILRWIRSKPEYDRIPFILLTARTEPRIVREAMGGGADDFLTKPVTSEDFMSAIRSRLARVPRGTADRPANHTESVANPNSPDVADVDPKGGNRWNLTQRELEALNWLSTGKSNEEIAKILGVALGTVKRHYFSTFAKLGVKTRTAAVVMLLSNPTLMRLVQASITVQK